MTSFTCFSPHPPPPPPPTPSHLPPCFFCKQRQTLPQANRHFKTLVMSEPFLKSNLTKSVYTQIQKGTITTFTLVPLVSVLLGKCVPVEAGVRVGIGYVEHLPGGGHVTSYPLVHGEPVGAGSNRCYGQVENQRTSYQLSLTGVKSIQVLTLSPTSFIKHNHLARRRDWHSSCSKNDTPLCVVLRVKFVFTVTLPICLKYQTVYLSCRDILYRFCTSE